MHKYCKAYHLKDLRQFNGWVEKRAENQAELADETICYVWDDFTVVTSPILENSIIFDNVTPEWQHFCHTTLKFEIPEDLRYAYLAEEEQETAANQDTVVA
jgi:hypothetical protein